MLRLKRLVCEMLFRAGGAAVFKNWVDLKRGNPLRILSAHRVIGDRETPSERDREDLRRGCLTVNAFVAAIEYLRRHYRIVPLAKTVESVHSTGKPGRDRLVLTFDDGFVDVYSDVYPLLKREGIPFTVFLTTGLVGKPGMLSGDQVREMAREPLVSWGAHGVTHRPLTDISPAEAEKEAADSRKAAEALTGKTVNLFCYPDGKHNDAVRQLLVKHGFVGACATGRTLNCGTLDPYALKRIPFEAEPLARFAFRVAGLV